MVVAPKVVVAHTDLLFYGVLLVLKKLKIQLILSFVGLVLHSINPSLLHSRVLACLLSLVALETERGGVIWIAGFLVSDLLGGAELVPDLL